MSPSEYQGLIAFLGERFEAIDHRFEAMEQHFETVDHRFETIDQRLGSIEHRLEDLRAEILGHFDELYRRLEHLEQEYMAIAQALRRIEAVLADEVGRREGLERDLTTLRENVAVLKARIEAIEKRLSSS
jgi:predicted  nucleic acid-binding Zn-ribbon protein